MERARNRTAGDGDRHLPERRRQLEALPPIGVATLRLADPGEVLACGLSSEAFHEVVLVGDKVHRAAERLYQLRVALLRARHDLVADEGAEVVRVRVGGVLAPEVPLRIAYACLAGLFAFAQVVAQILATNVEQRARNGAVLVAHRAKAAGARADDRAHIEALDAVVGGVRREDAPAGKRRARMAAQALERLVRREVALAACDRLHVAARASDFSCHVDIAHEQGNRQGVGQLGHEGGVGVGVLAAQVVVHVQHREHPELARLGKLAGGIGERRGVRPARHHEEHRGISIGHPVRRDGRPHALKYVHDYSTSSSIAGSTGSKLEICEINSLYFFLCWEIAASEIVAPSILRRYDL